MGASDEESDDLIPVPSWPVLGADAMQGNAGVLVRMLEDTTEADPVAILACLVAATGVWSARDRTSRWRTRSTPR